MTIQLNNIPASVLEGYEETGEIDLVNEGDLYLHYTFGDGWQVRTWQSETTSNEPYIIVRIEKPKIWVPGEGDAYQFLMLRSEHWFEGNGNSAHKATGNRFKTGKADILTAINAVILEIGDE